MPRRRTLLLAASATVALLLPRLASPAGRLSVSPTRVDLSVETGTATIAVRNDSDVATVLQVGARRWLDSPMPDALEPAPELIAVPPVFTLPPGKQQVIRLALRDRSRPTAERTWRLLVTEVPAPAAGSGEGGVHFALGFNLPVFQKPGGALAQPVWSLRNRELGLSNTGTAHVQVRRIELKDPSGRSIGAITDSFYLLPGRSRHWPVDAATRSLTLVADTNLGPIEQHLVAAGD